MEPLEAVTDKGVRYRNLKLDRGEYLKYPVSFAEQYLETPVVEGKDAIKYGVTVTFCTFRNFPVLDDY